MDTFMAKDAEVVRKWYIIDASGKALGRVAAEAAKVLRGKNKPIFTPHVDTGDHVIVINAAQVVLTGKKATQNLFPSILDTKAAENLLQLGNFWPHDRSESWKWLSKACCRKIVLARIPIVSSRFTPARSILILRSSRKFLRSTYDSDW